MEFKPLFVVLLIASVVFWLAKPFALSFSSETDFTRRRNLWLVLTAAAFLSPSFLIFSLFAIPIYFWGARKDSNPAAFYLLFLQIIPDIPISVPILITIDNYNLLAFFVLIPTWIRARANRDAFPRRSLDAMDLGIIAFGILQAIIFIVPDLPGHAVIGDSPTNHLRRAILFASGELMVYLTFSRCTRNIAAIGDAFSTFCLSCVILAGIGAFESLRDWYLYSDLGGRWTGDANYGFYLTRGTSLRAKSSTNSPLELGYLLSVGMGFWLSIAPQVKSRMTRWSVPTCYCVGLLAAYSRGPWIGVCVIALSFLWVKGVSFKTVLRVFLCSAVALLAISLSPLGKRFSAVIPSLGGQVDTSSIDYRQRLFERCWDLIMANPFFGDQWAYFKMEDLRQGQGIIDFVNTYAEVAVFYGLIGLAFFFSPIFIGLIRTYREARLVTTDNKSLIYGSGIAACIIGSLVMLATTSFIGAYHFLFYVLSGLASSYSFLIAGHKRLTRKYDTNHLIS